MDCETLMNRSLASRGKYYGGVTSQLVLNPAQPERLSKAYCTEDGYTVIQSRGQFGNSEVRVNKGDHGRQNLGRASFLRVGALHWL